MFHYKTLILWIALGAVFTGLLTLGSLTILARQRSYGVNQLWQMMLEDKKLEGKSMTVRGDAIFMPQSDFKFNALYLVDSIPRRIFASLNTRSGLAYE